MRGAPDWLNYRRGLCGTDDRNEVFENRFNVMSPNFINDDLPPSMRRDYAVMRQQKRKLIEDGTEIQQIKMDWSRRIVKTPFTSYKITNGLAIQEEHAEKTSFSQKQSQGQHKLSKNSRGRPWDCFR